MTTVWVSFWKPLIKCTSCDGSASDGAANPVSMLWESCNRRGKEVPISILIFCISLCIIQYEEFILYSAFCIYVVLNIFFKHFSQMLQHKMCVKVHFWIRFLVKPVMLYYICKKEEFAYFKLWCFILLKRIIMSLIHTFFLIFQFF